MAIENLKKLDIELCVGDLRDKESLRPGIKKAEIIFSPYFCTSLITFYWFSVYQLHMRNTMRQKLASIRFYNKWHVKEYQNSLPFQIIY